MSGGQNREIKDAAWALGKDLEADIDVWMEDKWALDHGVTLSTIAYDARNNTNVLARYRSAENELIRLNNSMKLYVVPKKGWLRISYHERLKNLINKTNVALPQGMDITDGDRLFNNRPVGERKGFIRSQQKTYRSILEHVSVLLEYTCGFYADGIESIKAKRKDECYSAIGALESVDFMKTMRGYSSGICHAAVYNNLISKLVNIKCINDDDLT